LRVKHVRAHPARSDGASPKLAGFRARIDGKATGGPAVARRLRLERVGVRVLDTGCGVCALANFKRAAFLADSRAELRGAEPAAGSVVGDNARRVGEEAGGEESNVGLVAAAGGVAGGGAWLGLFAAVGPLLVVLAIVRAPPIRVA